MLLAASVVVAVLGLVLAAWSLAARKARGLTYGKTLSLDSVTLTSKSLGLTGRPDRVVRHGGSLIVEEWKSKPKRLYPSHRSQMGVYFLLVEEHYGEGPSHGVVVLGDGMQERVENSEALRNQVLEIVDKIRDARQSIGTEIPVSPPSWLCRGCGQRNRCRQSRA